MNTSTVNSTPWISYLTILLRALFSLIILTFPFILPYIFSHFMIPPRYDGISNEDLCLQNETGNGMSGVETIHSRNMAYGHPTEEEMRARISYCSAWSTNLGEWTETQDSDSSFFVLSSHLDFIYMFYYCAVQGSFNYQHYSLSSRDCEAYFAACTFVSMSYRTEVDA